MRILIAHAFYRIPGGEDRYVEQQRELLGQTHEVDLLSVGNTELAHDAATAARMIYSRRAVAAVESRIRRFRPDVIHVHNVYPGLGPAVHLAASRSGVPLVATVHNYRLRCPNGQMFTEGALCRRCEPGFTGHAVLHRCFPSRSQALGYASALWFHRAKLRLEDKVAMFIAPSEFVATQLKRWGIEPDRVRTIRNFTNVPVSVGSSPGSYGASVGRLSSEKGLDVLLRALRTAGDPPFILAGDGPERDRLEGLAREMGLRQVRFAGRLDAAQVRTVMEGARFVAFPSRWHENAPLAALEAMALGRPLIVSERGGLPELASGGAGFVCSPNDAADLAAKIQVMMGDDDLCRRTGAAARAFAVKEFVPGRHLARLEELYATVVSERALSVAGGGVTG